MATDLQQQQIILAIAHFARYDPQLAQVVAMVRGSGQEIIWTTPKPERALQVLVRSIVGQQISRKAAESIFNRIQQLTGHPITPAPLLAASEAELRGLGLSASKMRAIQELAHSCNAGTFDSRGMHARADAMMQELVTEVAADGALSPATRQRSDKLAEAIMLELTKQRGIGPWTAQIFMMFQLRLCNILPQNDVGLFRSVSLALETETRIDQAQLGELAEKWIPFRSIACMYLWRFLHLQANA